MIHCCVVVHKLSWQLSELSVSVDEPTLFSLPLEEEQVAELEGRRDIAYVMWTGSVVLRWMEREGSPYGIYNGQKIALLHIRGNVDISSRDCGRHRYIISLHIVTQDRTINTHQ